MPVSNTPQSRLFAASCALFFLAVFSVPAAPWSPDKALEELSRILELTDDRAKEAADWVRRVDEKRVDLGEHEYVKAFGLLAEDRKEEALDLLVAHILKKEGLGGRPCVFGKQLDELLRTAVKRSMEKRNYQDVLLLLDVLAEHGLKEPYDIFAVAGTMLAQSESAEALSLRTKIAALTAVDSRISEIKKDHIFGLLYGKVTDAPLEGQNSAFIPLPPGVEFSAPHFLIVGGGGSPMNNQVSLEKNVEFLHRLQAHAGVGTNRNHILFSDGTNEWRDVQLFDKANSAPELYNFVAYLLGSSSGISYDYRSHKVPHIRGESSRENLQKYFDDLTADDVKQVFINFTGHGGRGEKNNALNTSLYLWNNKSIRMKDFCKMLDQVPPETPTVLLMVQCYSGGFANIIFKEGDPKKGLTDYARCGFFSTVHDRVAAGCTPDINEANYQEYSSYFIAALNNETRSGETIERPDFDLDGKVSFAEAHAYALIESKTLDISVKTSDVFLREFSQVGHETESPDRRLMRIDHYGVLWNAAAPCERAVLDGLSAKLSLCGDRRVAEAKRRLHELEKVRGEADKRKSKARKDISEVRRELGRVIKNRWPELSNPWHPKVSTIMEEQGEEIMATLRKHEKFKSFESHRAEINTSSKEHLRLDKEWAWYRRFVRTAENVALEANLIHLASEEIQERFFKLQELEFGTLGDGEADE